MNPNELSSKEKEVEGKRIRELRQRLGLSRQELASAANVSISVIEKIEIGQAGSRAMVDHLIDTMMDGKRK